MNNPAYIIIRVDVRDWEPYSEYVKHTPRVVKQYGGRMIARGAESETLEGEKEERRIVVLEFPSMVQAKTFYHSKEYQAAKSIRKGAASAQFVAINGYPAEEWERVVEASERLV